MLLWGRRAGLACLGEDSGIGLDATNRVSAICEGTPYLGLRFPHHLTTRVLTTSFGNSTRPHGQCLTRCLQRLAPPTTTYKPPRSPERSSKPFPLCFPLMHISLITSPPLNMQSNLNAIPLPSTCKRSCGQLRYRCRSSGCFSSATPSRRFEGRRHRGTPSYAQVGVLYRSLGIRRQDRGPLCRCSSWQIWYHSCVFCITVRSDLSIE